MNYINKDKNYMTDAERIRYLEESIRELRKEKENLKKEKGELKSRLEEENRLLKNEIAWLKDHTKYNYLKDELYIDWTMTATEAKLRLEQARQNQIYVSNLEEENKVIKEEKEMLIRQNTLLQESNKKLKEKIDELERTDEQLAKKLKSVVSGDNEQMHADADQLLSDFLRAIWYNKSADQYDEMSKDFRYA